MVKLPDTGYRIPDTGYRLQVNIVIVTLLTPFESGAFFG